MVLKKFSIQFKGVATEIEYEDDMPFGRFEEIIKKCSNFKEGSNPVNNVQTYRKEIMLNSLKKAPFEISEDGLNALGYKEVTSIAEKILASYPLGSYLSQMMKPFEESAKKIS